MAKPVKYRKKKLVAIARRVTKNESVTPDEIDYILSFNKKSESGKTGKTLKVLALPLSLGLGFFFNVYPDFFERLTKSLPSWTNLSPTILSGVDYWWDFIGEPVRKTNILYHLPNIVLYSFGVVGAKKVFDAIDKRTWLDRVLTAKKVLLDQIQKGNVRVSLKKGHSVLFVGQGDFIGAQFTFDAKKDKVITIAQTKPLYDTLWNYYDPATTYQDLEDVVVRSSGETAGEYIFFPVKDDQIFLPGVRAFDLSPYKLDIICQDIRTIEKDYKWPAKKIIIVGDRFHQSFVHSADETKVLARSKDVVSLERISQKHKNVTLLDPTDIVLEKVLEIAEGRKIVFRATTEGIKEYKKRFFDRLTKLGYKKPKKKGILTIGYDLFEDQTEQQTLSRSVDDYFPVVLSKNVKDALIRNGYKPSEFLYVPDLVLRELKKTAAQQ